MGDVIAIDAKRPQPSGTVAGPAVCLGCRHQWVAVAPHGTVELECPACGLGKGRWLQLIYPEDCTVFKCNCGNDLFFLSRKGAVCPVCGSWPDWV